MNDTDPQLLDIAKKLLAVLLYAQGMAQGQIASRVGKSKSWVNDFLRGLDKGHRSS